MRVSCRKNIHGTFVKDVSDALSEFGWSLIILPDGYGIIFTEVVERWTRISSRRVKDKIAEVAGGKTSEEALITKLLDSLGADGDDEEPD